MYNFYNIRGQEKPMGEEENRRNLEKWEKVLENDQRIIRENKEIEEDAYIYIYTEEGQKKEIMERESKFTEDWKNSIYKKMDKTDFSFWYGSNGEKGLKKIMEEELNKGDSGIMETPTISEEEFIKVIKNMQNRKASGVDNIPAELMKHLIKNEKIRTYMLKCFDKALTEEIHEDWLLSRTTMIPKNKKPKILEHRPIAVTVNSSKIICSVLRKKIEAFLEDNNIIYENQFGFTSGGS